LELVLDQDIMMPPLLCLHHPAAYQAMLE